MKVSDFNYNLPKELIAQVPIKNRDESRLMILGWLTIFTNSLDAKEIR